MKDLSDLFKERDNLNLQTRYAREYGEEHQRIERELEHNQDEIRKHTERTQL